jgi:SAM-dependent methyltransferase
MKIYSSYDEEPEDIYLPLPDELYTEFYDLEMHSFQQDLQFYLSALPEKSTILETGCGSGRLTRLLAEAGHHLVGVDLSQSMLQAALQSSTGKENYICMDMRTLSLRRLFDAIIVPYNTLNLMTTRSDIESCLRSFKRHLKPEGMLLLQLYIPPMDFTSPSPRTTFKFQMFDRPEGGKIIKEILQRPLQENQQLEMIERYKLRPMTTSLENVNYSHTMLLNACDQATWLEILNSAGFTSLSLANAYDGSYTPEKESTILLIKATHAK